jgi:hypothetical protein
MLAHSRKICEKIYSSKNISITVVDINRGRDPSGHRGPARRVELSQGTDTRTRPPRRSGQELTGLEFLV